MAETEMEHIIPGDTDTYQGRLEPLQPHANKNKRGLGAEKIKRKTMELPKDPASRGQNENDDLKFRKKTKGCTKKIRKMQEKEKQMLEKEFEQAFFREFWPDNV